MCTADFIPEAVEKRENPPLVHAINEGMLDGLSEGIQRLTILFPVFLVAVIFHEWAHGWMALRFGDGTAKEHGRLTLNPLPHIDPMGTILFPMLMMAASVPILFGWAKPVPIDPRRFTKARAGLFWVSFAGAGMNFLLGILSAAALCSIVKWGTPDFYLYEPMQEMAKASITLNFAIGIFNLIPIPPLDGSKILMSVASPRFARALEGLESYSMWILLAVFIFGGNFLQMPILFLSNTTLWTMANLFGLTQ